MSGAAKFATNEMKAACLEKANLVLAGTEGPCCLDDSVRPYIPEDPLPCEAWALYNSDGVLLYAKSADKMNGWYFHVDVMDQVAQATANGEEPPADPKSIWGWSYFSYPAQDNMGNEITINSESETMAQFIRNEIPYFFINGERFTQTCNRDPDDHSYYVTCSGALGRGALVHLDTAGTGASIYVYSSSAPVPTDQRMNAGSVLPALQLEGTNPRDVITRVTPYSKDENSSIFWAVGYAAS